MHILRKFSLALILSLGSTPTLADTWLCNVNASTGQGVIGPEIAFTFDNASSHARVIDGVIAELEGGPRVADVVRSGKIKALIWDFPRPKISSRFNKGTIQYRASLLPNNDLIVTVHDLGGGRKAKARGACKRTGETLVSIGEFGQRLDRPLNRRW